MPAVHAAAVEFHYQECVHETQLQILSAAIMALDCFFFLG
jgi:hypothetical protein